MLFSVKEDAGCESAFPECNGKGLQANPRQQRLCAFGIEFAVLCFQYIGGLIRRHVRRPNLVLDVTAAHQLCQQYVPYDSSTSTVKANHSRADGLYCDALTTFLRKNGRATIENKASQMRANAITEL